MWFKTRRFSATELDRFREFQRLSFSILTDEARQLATGVTEREAARRLVKAYRRQGVKSFFHLPVVLFGERTALPGDWTVRQFFPKQRAAAPGDAVIFDASPIFDGFLVDTSFSFCLGENPLHREMMRNLAEFRETVPAAVNAGATFKAIAEQVNDRFATWGYEPVHGKHPGKVLGHRALRLPRLPFVWRRQGFDALSLNWFLANELIARQGWRARSPLWNASPTSDHAPCDGLWLVEPHAGNDGVGAKWEEILMIDDGRARWLDDDVPHVRQWSLAAQARDYGPAMLHSDEAPHISFRSATADDMPWIAESIRELRLDDENLGFEQFIVAEREGRAVGFGRIKPYRDISELGCVGVLAAERDRGVGSRIVRELIRRFPSREVYITTDLIDYFEKLGFRRLDDPPRELADKLRRIEGRIRSGVAAMLLVRQDPP
jgi:N-acetylglutamate synthase-like GNAT family acetyltransferase